MRKYITLLLIIILIGCKSESNINFLFDRADGLDENSKVLFNGAEIGKITDISIHTDYRILVKCKLNGGVDIPSDSQIKIKTSDILGSKSLYIESGSSNRMLNNNDTLSGILEPGHKIDTIINKGLEIIDNIIVEIKEENDSIELKIKKLNEN